MPISIAKEYFNTYALKRHGRFSSTTLPHSIFCIRLRNIASRHRDQFAHETKTISASLEEFKGNDTFSVSEWLRQKGPEKLC